MNVEFNKNLEYFAVLW